MSSPRGVWTALPAQGDAEPGRPGRPPSTTHSDLEELCIALFVERGFDATSVDDIAAAAGIARRTFFRYYPSKADVVWGDFDAAVERMVAAYRHPDRAKELAGIPGAVPSPLRPPSGCRFHPRCPEAVPACSAARPPLARIGDGREVACVLYGAKGARA